MLRKICSPFNIKLLRNCTINATSLSVNTIPKMNMTSYKAMRLCSKNEREFNLSGSQYYQQDSKYALENWENYEKIIKDYAKLPNHMYLPTLEHLKTHIQDRGVTFIRDRFRNDEKFFQMLCGFLENMVKFNKTTPMMANILTIMHALEIGRTEFVDEMERNLEKIMQDRESLVKYNDASSQMQCLGYISILKDDESYCALLLGFIKEEKKFFNIPTKITAIESQVKLNQCFEDPKIGELQTQIQDELPQQVQHSDLWEYLTILAFESRLEELNDEKHRKPPVFILEKKFYDIASELNTPQDLVSVIECFAKLNHQSDKLWELLTKAIINVIPVLSEEMLVKVVKSFSQVKRGSNTLWDFFTKKVNERFENMNGEQLVTLLFGKFIFTKIQQCKTQNSTKSN